MTNNRLPKVGIVGGAGPMAGLLLFQKVIQLCQQTYGCQQDADFPYLMLLNYPFADMLKNQSADQQLFIQKQLNECFDTFVSNGIEVGAIACNTLHAFLNTQSNIQIVNMIEQIAQTLKQRNIHFSLVLCSNTSVKSRVHQSCFNCFYPQENWQVEVDALIDKVLAGQETLVDVKQLINAIHFFYSNVDLEEEQLGIVLGCTEFSVLNEKWPFSQYGLDERLTVIDSTQVLAEGVCQSIFNKTKTNTKAKKQ